MKMFVLFQMICLDKILVARLLWGLLLIAWLNCSASNLIAAGLSSSFLQVQANSSTVSIEAENAPLVDILRSIGTQVGFEVVAEDKGPRRTFSVKDMPISNTLDKLLLGTNFIIEYVPRKNPVPSASRPISRIFLLPRVSSEKAEEERVSRQTFQAHEFPKANQDEALPQQEYTSTDFSSESTVSSEELSIPGTLPPSSNDSESLEVYQDLHRQLNPDQGVSSPFQGQPNEPVSNQQIPLSLQQQALDQVKKLAEQLEAARQQINIP